MEKTFTARQTFFFSAVIFLCFFVVLEAGTRFFLFFKTRSADFLVYGFQDDDNRKHGKMVKIEDTDGNVLYFKQTPSSDPDFPVNTHGFRGAPIQERKSPRTVRIVCLGGSTTYGLCLDHNDTYPQRLQTALNAHATKHQFEVINAGIPGLTLPQITHLAQREIMAFQPDIIVVMSLINNLAVQTPWGELSFFIIEGEEKGTIRRVLSTVKRKAVDVSAFAFLVNGLIERGARDYLHVFDWHRFAEALTASDTVWSYYRDQLCRLLDVVREADDGVIVYLLEQPINTIDYPELQEPVEKAIAILRNVSAEYNDVQTVNSIDEVLRAQKNGTDVWTHSYYDPVHLSGDGNQIIASQLASLILAHAKEW